MHPNTFILSLAALASVAISTKDKDNGPRCPEDEYYNTMMESKNRRAAATDCARWLGGTITDPKEIPKYLKDCGGDKEEDRVSRVSAACSCIAISTVSATLSTQTHVSSTSSSSSVVTTSSQPPSHPPSTTTSSTSTYSSGLSSSQTTGTTTGTGSGQTTETSPPHTPSSQSALLPSSGSMSPPISSGHTGSSSTIPHSSTSISQSTTSLSVTRTHKTTGPSNTNHTQTTRSKPTDTHTTDSQARSSPSSSSSGASTSTSTASTQTVMPNSLSTLNAPNSSLTNVAPSQASTTSFTTSTICMYPQVIEQAGSGADLNHRYGIYLHRDVLCSGKTGLSSCEHSFSHINHRHIYYHMSRNRDSSSEPPSTANYHPVENFHDM